MVLTIVELKTQTKMDRQYQLTFFKSDFAQYNYILENEEIHNKIAGFLLKYISVESFYKKLLVAEKGNISAKNRKRLDVKIPEVKRVLDYFGVIYDEDLIVRIFGSNDKNYMDCSIKKLRDRLVHNVNDHVLRVILERYEDMNNDLDAFMALFK